MGSYLDLGNGTIHTTPITRGNETDELFPIHGDAIDGEEAWAEVQESEEGVWLVTVQVGCVDREGAMELYHRLHGWEVAARDLPLTESEE